MLDSGRACVFNPSRGRWIYEFEATMLYRASSKTVRATQRSPVSKHLKEKNNKSQLKNKLESD